MSKYKLVCFDLDDTLTHEVDSVKYLCILNGKGAEADEITRRELAGEIFWIDADYIRAGLIKGLPASNVGDKLTYYLKPLMNVSKVVKALHGKNIKCVVITAGPKQVSKAVEGLYGFDGSDGTDYEVQDGFFTGKIARHLGVTGKVGCLINICAKYGIKPEECIAVGDGITDIPLFEHCGMSIAINYSPVAEGKATHYIRTDDLYDILKYIMF